MATPRPLNERERQLLEKLFEKEFPKRETLRGQALNSLVIEDDDGTGTIYFLVGADRQPPHSVPVEAEYCDQDGGDVHILLHVREDTIFELEVYKDSPGPVHSWPDLSSLRIY